MFSVFYPVYFIVGIWYSIARIISPKKRVVTRVKKT